MPLDINEIHLKKYKTDGNINYEPSCNHEVKCLFLVMV
jgi:hypothetical protein